MEKTKVVEASTMLHYINKNLSSFSIMAEE